MQSQVGPHCQQTVVSNSTQLHLEPGPREKQAGKLIQLEMHVFEDKDVFCSGCKARGHLLCRWSVNVIVVQTDRGVAEQKVTVQVREVTLCSWLWVFTGCPCVDTTQIMHVFIIRNLTLCHNNVNKACTWSWFGAGIELPSGKLIETGCTFVPSSSSTSSTSADTLVPLQTQEEREDVVSASLTVDHVYIDV